MDIINLDYAAASPLDKQVLDKMLPYFAGHYGNPSSGHELGEKPRKALQEARFQAGRLIGGDDKNIIFTASASEANNLAIKGVASRLKLKGNHIIASSIEHFSVLNQLKTLEREGLDVTLLPVDQYGVINAEVLSESIRNDTMLVSIQTVNPEIGTIQPIAELSAIARERGVLFHTDATAAAGWIPLDINQLGVDLLTFAGDQFNGPKGAAALYVRKGVGLNPLIEGGIQERGLRAGTENVPAIVGFGEAARLAADEFSGRVSRVGAFRDELQKSIFDSIPHVHLNGHPEKRSPRILNLSVAFVEGEALLMRLNMAGIMVSSGSSCTSQVLKSSHVLNAIGLTPELAQGSLLFTINVENVRQDIPYITESLGKVAGLLRNMSPLYYQYLKEAGKNA